MHGTYSSKNFAQNFGMPQNVMINFKKPHFWVLLRVLSLNLKSVCPKKLLFMSYQQCGLWLSMTVLVPITYISCWKGNHPQSLQAWSQIFLSIFLLLLPLCSPAVPHCLCLSHPTETYYLLLLYVCHDFSTHLRHHCHP